VSVVGTHCNLKSLYKLKVEGVRMRLLGRRLTMVVTTNCTAWRNKRTVLSQSLPCYTRSSLCSLTVLSSTNTFQH